MLPYPHIDPVAVQIGPLAIRWYGLSYLAGILGGWWLLRRRAQEREEWDAGRVDDLVFQVALGAVLGGRIGYVLFYNLPGYLADPLAVFRVWEGGMSFHGGLLGALAALWYFAHGHHRGFLVTADFLAPVVPLGLFFGRLANFINGELWGRPTDLPWAMVFPDPRAGGIPRHPSQLYEATLEGLVLFGLLWFYSARPRPAGSVSGLFLAGYGCARFLVEFAREPDPQLGYLAFGWFTMGQLLSLPMVVAGLALIWFSSRSEEVKAR
ncbi:MAG: prolipoprotein diacylglyceryl transferase [Gammaproteobacteria bacterium]|nr:MAG: prolipoprotein diacylglyceryl transferase [Gammaproteobacteria bacterium]